MADAAQELTKKKRFCRRCLLWHKPASAKTRLEPVRVGRNVVLMDYVLCAACFERDDHAWWYAKRAADRARLGYQDELVSKAIRCDEPTASRGTLWS